MHRMKQEEKRKELDQALEKHMKGLYRLSVSATQLDPFSLFIGMSYARVRQDEKKKELDQALIKCSNKTCFSSPDADTTSAPRYHFSVPVGGWRPGSYSEQDLACTLKLSS